MTNPSRLRLSNPDRKSSSPGRDGFSILEVILALAILAGSIAVLGEVASLGMRNAQVAGHLTHAQLLCEGKLAEITAGITAPDPVRDVQFELPVGDGKIAWVYSIDVMDIDEDGLVAVCVTVRQNLPPNKRPVTCSLIRWIVDPQIELSEPAESESEEDEI
ncbi:MAG: prepilin-type N-terminal cleavage/methylation domain-containing protein [Candidatus Nealsonbacteria bacterium]|nr:prepilin-type N-terminal cleavage/methylation domain-containing protein [Candidatus Nealsonbacteria bacterium]